MINDITDIESKEIQDFIYDDTNQCSTTLTLANDME